jgi:hypothetical protein
VNTAAPELAAEATIPAAQAAVATAVDFVAADLPGLADGEFEN